jgi:hypothetical protein
MKHVFIALLLAGFTLSASAQQKVKVKTQDVPANVQTALKTAFPDAKDIDWTLKEGMYKASFEVNGKDHFAKITNDGQVKVKGSEIMANQLPEAVTSAIKSAYANWKIDDVFQLEEDGTTSYLIELDGHPDKHVYYTADGQLVKETEDEG